MNVILVSLGIFSGESFLLSHSRFIKREAQKLHRGILNGFLTKEYPENRLEAQRKHTVFNWSGDKGLILQAAIRSSKTKQSSSSTTPRRLFWS
jgi:hypothetical protein